MLINKCWCSFTYISVFQYGIIVLSVTIFHSTIVIYVYQRRKSLYYFFKDANHYITLLFWIILWNLRGYYRFCSNERARYIITISVYLRVHFQVVIYAREKNVQLLYNLVIFLAHTIRTHISGICTFATFYLTWC